MDRDNRLPGEAEKYYLDQIKKMYDHYRHASYKYDTQYISMKFCKDIRDGKITHDEARNISLILIEINDINDNRSHR